MYAIDVPGTGLPEDSDGVAADAVQLSSGELAARRIRHLIFDGALPPGSRIPQDEIAESFGISRIPLREALIALEREGWVVLKLHRGAFVNALDRASLLDHYDMLGEVYAFAAVMAMRRTTDLDDLVAELRSIGDGIDANGTPEATGRSLRRFHIRLIRAAESSRIEVLLRAIPSLIPGDIFSLLPGVIDIERAAIAKVVDGVATRDEQVVRDEYRNMMHAVGQEVAVLFQQRELFGGDEALAADGIS